MLKICGGRRRFSLDPDPNGNFSLALQWLPFSSMKLPARLARILHLIWVKTGETMAITLEELYPDFFVPSRACSIFAPTSAAQSGEVVDGFSAMQRLR